ncbi:MAG: hypothetical protein JW790_04485 [Dehalococcoidales bacterium]|nr:hypothetical protein [Dehalococcoidales bacterium]
MSRKKKLILIGIAMALAVGVGGAAYAYTEMDGHQDVGGHKLIGVGEMGYYDNPTLWDQEEWWDTSFIITNPNCDRDLTIEWVSLIAGDEQVIAEGTPDDWYDYANLDVPETLSAHEVWQVSIAELLGELLGSDPLDVMYNFALSKYTLEVTWSGVRWRGWWGWGWWGWWGSDRPLLGWQKEKCGTYVPTIYYVNGVSENAWNSFCISEAEMQVFPNRVGFEAGLPYFPSD